MKSTSKHGAFTFILLALTLSGCSLLNVVEPGKIKRTVESMVRFKSELPKDYQYTYAGSITDANSHYAVINNKSKNLQLSIMSINDYDPTTSTKSLPAKLAGFLDAKVTKKEERVIGGKKLVVKHVELSEDSDSPSIVISVMLTKPNKHTDFVLIDDLNGTEPYDEKAANEILNQIATFL